MPLKYFVFFVILSLSTSLTAQFSSHRTTLTVAFQTQDLERPYFFDSIPLTDIAPFLSFFLVWKGETDQFNVRFSKNAGEWSDWSTLQRDSHNPDANVTELFITRADYRFFQIQKPQQEASNIIAHFFSPGNTPEIAPVAKNNPLEEQGNCDIPSIVDRRDWCPNGNCPSRSGPQFTEVSHLIVHHSAGTNNANDWAAIVRAIYDLHVNGNGWADIGYNYLVDPNGVVYEGRGEDVLGAHFCARNSNTMGVCVMGNFQNQAPTDEAVNSLVNMLSWKAFKENIDPIGRSLHPSSGLFLTHISGHRQGCATACPGDQFFPIFNDLRGRVRDSIELCSNVTSTDELAVLQNLSLSPNPAVDHVQLRGVSQTSTPLFIHLLGPDGQIIKRLPTQTTRADFSVDIDLSDLPSGTYFVRILQAQSIQTLRFVKW